LPNYLKSQALPGGVMKILNQLAIKYKLQAVDVDEVRQEFETLSGLGKDIFDEHYIFEEDEVRDRINAQLIGQPDAVDSLTDIVQMIKAKLNTPGKPLSSFMFIGPTGVGKTQAAKVLCKYLMGNEDHLMRFDMNEYIDDYAVDRLIGDYYNPEGQLTGKVRYKPFGILLLDEIEKANPKVHDLLLQVLDDGRLSDSLGRTVDFSNTIIIMTSNIGAREVDSVLGFKSEQSDDSAIYRKEMENHFRPEFLNRIDKVVIFKPLELLHMYSIARLQINELLRRDGFVRRTTMLNIDPDALKWVADRGFNKRMGGRALKRQIERDLTSLSAEQLISTQTDRPIIFEILFKNNQLFPNVIPLDFVDSYQENWLPDLPSEKQGRRFYGHLLRIIEGIESELYQFEREQGFGEEDANDDKTYSFGGEDDLDKNDKDYVDDSNWMYYQFKDRVSELKERIKDTLLGFQNKYYVSSPVIPLRLKRVGFLNDGNSVHRRSMMDKLFQEAAMDDLSDTYRFNATEFDRLNTQFLDNWLDVALLRLYFNGLLSQSVDVLEIGFHSYIAGLGDKEIDFLIGRYKEMFHGLDLFYHFNKEEKIFLIEGYGLNELLKGEDGIHLFYIPHQNPLPIRVSVKKDEVKKKNKEARNKMLKVIRLYNSTTTITDLRTNYTNAGNISSSEFKFLLYGGLDPQIRRGLMN
jgi:ATP-dependent Clp protease ATP-binding subunit ClpC